MAEDVICGMDVEIKPGAIQSTYEGKTYYFCSEGCKRAFEKKPRTARRLNRFATYRPRTE